MRKAPPDMRVGLLRLLHSTAGTDLPVELLEAATYGPMPPHATAQFRRYRHQKFLKLLSRTRKHFALTGNHGRCYLGPDRRFHVICRPDKALSTLGA